MRVAEIVLGFVLLAGCAGASHALPTEAIVVDTSRGPHKFTVEIAADVQSQEQGLMYRKSMAADAGMLFRFDHPQFLSFWMENTYIPLDMLFVRADGTISTIAENAHPLTTDPIRSAEPVLAVIELNGGCARALGIERGDKVHAAMFGDTLSPPAASDH